MDGKRWFIIEVYSKHLELHSYTYWYVCDLSLRKPSILHTSNFDFHLGVF